MEIRGSTPLCHVLAIGQLLQSANGTWPQHMAAPGANARLETQGLFSGSMSATKAVRSRILTSRPDNKKID